MRTCRSAVMPSSFKWACQAVASANCPGAPAERVDDGHGQLLPSPVALRDLVDHIVGVRPTEDFQEIEPALALGALEAGEQVVADLGAVAVTPPVPCPGVVHLDKRR